MTAPLLSIRGLSVVARLPDHEHTLLNNISLDVGKAEVVGLVGESGSGKSLLCRSIIGLMPSRSLVLTHGSVFLRERDIARASDAELQKIRGGEIGMIFQNPTSHLDPVMRIGDQIVEGIVFHRKVAYGAAKAAALDIMAQVGFTDPPRQFMNYPHEFSGGMRQRAMIAVALSCDPELLIADEPTTALDVTIQAQILKLLLDIRDARGLSIILITHDLGVVAQTCDRIAVMQAGKIVEQGDKRQILRAPAAAYTKKLIASHGPLPDEDLRERQNARLGHIRPILEIDDLFVRFPTSSGWLSKRRSFAAVDGLSLQVMPGETIGIVGESGSGKSTLARAMLGLQTTSSGHVTFDGVSLRLKPREALAKLQSEAAMVFQDPLNSLNPRFTIGETLAEVLRVQGKVAPDKIEARVGELLDLVELDRSFAGRKPRSMSGGQCQRAGIARALAVEPKLIVADECIAALDVTIQAQIVALFRRLVRQMNLTLVFIAHDLAVVRYLCERVVVMHHGKIVEEGPSDIILAKPRRTYTANLLAAVPDIDPDKSLFRPLPITE
ncbi:ABC transporter ATP-binding protein [Oryzifoliimicrobium ureilyticus]|uniref:ABC transporter ATP-binding protein n=1 Tax=Oryzifoliimicrobium ureilyticus TaxID=3113724 RepID=UPI003075F165